MTYTQALAAGTGKCGTKLSEESLLAAACHVVSLVHAINPTLVFDGARKKGLRAKDVCRLSNDDPIGLSDLMFVQ